MIADNGFKITYDMSGQPLKETNKKKWMDVNLYCNNLAKSIVLTIKVVLEKPPFCFTLVMH